VEEGRKVMGWMERRGEGWDLRPKLADLQITPQLRSRLFYVIQYFSENPLVWIQLFAIILSFIFRKPPDPDRDS
jgi:hypothetical protein